ncbi:MAG: CPBP family intramembrane glutamic endopeptidase [Polyangia bacterium]
MQGPPKAKTTAPNNESLAGAPGGEVGDGLGDGPAAEPGPITDGVLPLALRGQLDALSLFLLALLLLVVVGGVTQQFRAGPPGMAVTELLAILLPALLWSRVAPGRSPEQVALGARRRSRLGVLRTLRLVPPSPRRGLQLLGGGALWGGALFLVLAVFIEPLFELWLPVPPEERAALLSLLRPPEGLRPLALDLVCFALVPAVCEEVLFRGAILTGLRGYARAAEPGEPGRGRRSRALAVLLCALLFGAFHRSMAKLLPTSALGLGFGVAAVYSGSLWPAIAMHAVNNALVVLLVRSGRDDVAVDARLGPLSLQGLVCLVATVALFLLGARLLRPGRARAADRTAAPLP